MLHTIPHKIDSISATVAEKTKPFIETSKGKFFLSLVLLSPFSFIPTVYQAWTASNIDVLRTWTWPLMLITGVSSLLGLIHNGDWRMRFVSIVWNIIIASIWLATLVR